MKRRIGAVVLGVASAAMPLVALAAEGHGSTFEAANRAQDPSADWGMMMLFTFLAVAALFLVAGIGYTYRRQRGLDWEFQKPDVPHDDHHDDAHAAPSAAAPQAAGHGGGHH